MQRYPLPGSMLNNSKLLIRLKTYSAYPGLKIEVYGAPDSPVNIVLNHLLIAATTDRAALERYRVVAL